MKQLNITRSVSANRGTVPLSNQIVKPWFILTSLTSHDSISLLECKLHYILMVYYRVFSNYLECKYNDI